MMIVKRVLLNSRAKMNHIEKTEGKTACGIKYDVPTGAKAMELEIYKTYFHTCKECLKEVDQ